MLSATAHTASPGIIITDHHISPYGIPHTDAGSFQQTENLPRRVKFVSTANASFAVEFADENHWIVSYAMAWPDIGESSGSRRFTVEQLRNAFGIGEAASMFVIGGLCGRREGHLTVPDLNGPICNGASSISILLNRDIKNAVRGLLARCC